MSRTQHQISRPGRRSGRTVAGAIAAQLLVGLLAGAAATPASAAVLESTSDPAPAFNWGWE